MKNMKFEDLFNLFYFFSPWLFLKIITLFLLGIYVCFALILVRQISLMTKTVYGQFETFLKIVSKILLITAVGVLIISFVYL